MTALDAHIETPPVVAGSQGFVNVAIGLGRQLRVGVQKEQHLAAGGAGAGVELRGTAPWRLQHTVGVRLRNGGCAVGAATVHHNELGTARAPWGERLQARGEGSGLVERGHHDGERLHADNSRSSISKCAGSRKK